MSGLARLSRLALGLGLFLGAAVAHGQAPGDIVLPDIGTPPPAPAPGQPGTSRTTDQGPVVDVDSDIDIANIVIGSTKNVTTVQEAPSIITIVTADEIRARGFRTVMQALTVLPGWIPVEAEGNQVDMPLVRGTAQAALTMRDGISFFDPILNVATIGRALPIETVKRIEVVTGPGGVLWGANSFLGVVNIITKDADDVNGLEVSAGYGDGRGSPQDVHAYAMFGKSFLDKKLKVFLHGSFDTFMGSMYRRPAFLATSPSPQPQGPLIYGRDENGNTTIVDTAPDRSWLVNLDGKISYGPLTLSFMYPLGEIHKSLNFSAGAVTNDRNLPPGIAYADSGSNHWNFYDRYGALGYRDRFFGDRLGVDAKAYYVNFVRDLTPRVFSASGALPGGLTFKVPDNWVQRMGGSIDFDISWSGNLRGRVISNRVLAGAEAFYESASASTTRFLVPLPENLPLVCPLNPDGSYVPECPIPFNTGGDRTVVGVFIADQIRPLPILTFDGGIRYQRGFGKAGYDGQFLGSASMVWQFLTGYHLKLNFTQGFRPPVFNNLYAYGPSVQFAGNENLRVERSSAYQAEINARLLKNRRHVRELQLRLDYSYTLLENTIVVQRSKYANSGERGIHTVEFLGKLYLEGDHVITGGYTFFTAGSGPASLDYSATGGPRVGGSTYDAGASGRWRAMPNHWFTLGAVFNLVKDTLDVNGNLLVYGAFEDPNRFSNQSFVTPNTAQPATQARLSDLTFDRLPPVAVLQVGARLRLWKDRLIVSGQIYNAFNQAWYYPDVFYDHAPSIEVQPNPAPGFSFFTSVTWRPL